MSSKKSKACLDYCKKVTQGYSPGSVKSFKSKAWLSGSAFCALLHGTDPDLLDYDAMHAPEVTPVQRLAKCFAVIETMGVDDYLGAEDWAAMSAVEPLSLQTYLFDLIPKLKKRSRSTVTGVMSDAELLATLTAGTKSAGPSSSFAKARAVLGAVLSRNSPGGGAGGVSSDTGGGDAEEPPAPAAPLTKKQQRLAASAAKARQKAAKKKAEEDARARAQADADAATLAEQRRKRAEQARACSNFRLDLGAALHNTCKCGRLKSEHQLGNDKKAVSFSVHADMTTVMMADASARRGRMQSTHCVRADAPCDRFTLDLTAPSSLMCTCGRLKSEHAKGGGNAGRAKKKGGNAAKKKLKKEVKTEPKKEIKKAAKREAAKRDAAKREAAKRETAKREAAKREAAKKEAAKQAAKREAAKREKAKREAAKREAAKRETAKREAAKREAAKKEAAKQAVKRETAKKEAAKRQAAKKEEAKRDAAKREAAKREKAKRETAKREAAKRETAKREKAKREAAKREAAKREAAKKEKANREAAKQAAQKEAAKREAAKREAAKREVKKQPKKEVKKKATKESTEVVPPPVPEQTATVEQQLKKIFREHAPSKLKNLPGLLRKFRGKEEELLAKVSAKYGVSKSAATSDKGGKVSSVMQKRPAKASRGNSRQTATTITSTTSTADRVRKELQSIYTTHAPDKLKNLQSLLSKFKGKEHILLSKVKAKYSITDTAPAKQKRSGASSASTTAAKSSTGPRGATAAKRSSGAAARGKVSVAQIQRELRTIYRKHAPKKMMNIPSLLSKFKGKEQILLDKVRAKYNIT